MTMQDTAIDALKTAHSSYVETTRWVCAGVIGGFVTIYSLFETIPANGLDRILYLASIGVLFVSILLATLSIFKRADFWRRLGDPLLAVPPTAATPIVIDAHTERARTAARNLFQTAAILLIAGFILLAILVWRQYGLGSIFGGANHLRTVYEDNANIILVDPATKKLFHISKGGSAPQVSPIP